MRYLIPVLFLGLMAGAGVVRAQSPDTTATQRLDSLKLAWLLKEPNATPRHIDHTDRITQFYSAAVKSNFVSGEDGKFEFKSSLFGLKKLFDPDLDIDTTYLRRQFLRNFEITAGLTFGEDQKLDGFRPALKWALINRRDRSENNFYLDFKDEHSLIARALDSAGNAAIDKVKEDPQRRNDIFASMDKFNETRNLSDLDEMLRDEVFLRLSKPQLDSLQTMYDVRAKEVDRGVLVTLDAGWDITRAQKDSIFAGLGLFKGVGHGRDLVIKSRFGLKDTSATSFEFDRITWNNSLGLDLVLVRAGDQSLIEGNLNVEYDRVLRGLADDEDRETFNLSLTLSAVISEDISLPITVKWDPENGNLFALLDLQWTLKPIKKK